MKKEMETIQKKSGTELQKDLSEARESLRTFRFKAAGSNVRNNKEGRSLRTSIARMLTEINRRARTDA